MQEKLLGRSENVELVSEHVGDGGIRSSPLTVLQSM